MIQFHSDKITVRGPKIDGSYVVSFEVGEYEVGKVSQLMIIPQQTLVKVKVEAD